MPLIYEVFSNSNRSPGNLLRVLIIKILYIESDNNSTNLSLHTHTHTQLFHWCRLQVWLDSGVQMMSLGSYPFNFLLLCRLCSQASSPFVLVIVPKICLNFHVMSSVTPWERQVNLFLLGVLTQPLNVHSKEMFVHICIFLCIFLYNGKLCSCWFLPLQSDSTGLLKAFSLSP